MTDHEPTQASLEHHLRSLGGQDDLFPATPEVAIEMRALIQSHTWTHVSALEPRRSGSIQDRPLRGVAFFALMVLTALAVGLVVPNSRTAIANFFGIEGIRIEVGQQDDAGVPEIPTSIGGSLLLGERSTLEEVSTSVPFDVVVPADDAAGEPDEVYLNQRSGAIVVGLLYEASDELPPIGATGVGMLLLEIDSIDGDVTFVAKSLGRDGRLVDTLNINGGTGYWIENGILTVEPLESLMLDDFGMETRRSGNVLVWSDGEITYRLETRLPMEDAVRIAESLQPAESIGNP